MNQQAFFKIGYGLYVLTAREGERDNGCIINTLTQVTSSPCRVTIAVNQQNLTHDMILRTGCFNVSILTEASDFSLFQRFGYQSGRKVDKFVDFNGIARDANGIAYLTEGANAYLACKVIQTTDLGTHTLFLAEVQNAECLCSTESVTYSFYQRNIKPAPKSTPKKGWRCPICGYVYENEDLPADFVCPICKHGAADFVRIETPTAATTPATEKKEFQNSKSKANLEYAFAGESMARNKYTFFAEIARREGYEQIAALFEQTAHNEKEHAKLWFQELGGLGTTLENLRSAASGEREEWTQMYRKFADVAQQEGLTTLQEQLERVALIEKRHEARYNQLASNIENSDVWERTGENRWECRNCGHVFIGKAAPKVCPVCSHGQGFFEIEAENY